jgi:hypothetical protein
MTTFTGAGLKTAGFRGFERFSATDLSRVPEGPGVYVLLREKGAPPVFLEHSPAGSHQGREATVPLDVLREAWVARTPLLYVGESKTLRKRITQLRRQGAGESANHGAGIYLWQLSDSGDLRLAWREEEDPAAAKRALLKEFRDAFGCRPFANSNDS